MTNRYTRLPTTTSAFDIPERIVPTGQQKSRVWEKRNRTYSYRIPTPLAEEAKELRETILSIAQHDEYGNPRADQTTVNQVASILLDWAIEQVRKNPKLLSPIPNPHSKGGMTLNLAAWDGWASGPIIPAPVKKKKPQKKENKSLPAFLGYRLPVHIDSAIRDFASQQQDTGPQKYAIPTGEVLVRLLRIAIDGYKNRRFRLTPSTSIVVEAGGWESIQNGR